jgi:glycyl-tRNA synthetase alpha subunit
LKKKIAEKLSEDFESNFCMDSKIIAEKFDGLKRLALDFVGNEFDYHKKYFLEKLEESNGYNRRFIGRKLRESMEGFEFFKQKLGGINFLFEKIDEYVSGIDKKGAGLKEGVDGLVAQAEGGDVDGMAPDSNGEMGETSTGVGLEPPKGNSYAHLEFLDRLKDIDKYMNVFCKESQNADTEFWKHANKTLYGGFFDCIDRDLAPRMKSQVHDIFERLNKSSFFIDGFAWQSSYALQEGGSVIQRIGQITSRSINGFYEESKKIIGKMFILNRLDLHLDACFQANSASLKFFTTICKALPITVTIGSLRLSIKNNLIGENSILDICYSIKQFKNIDSLNIDLSANILNSECVFAIAETMRYFGDLKSLSIDISKLVFSPIIFFLGMAITIMSGHLVIFLNKSER